MHALGYIVAIGFIAGTLADVDRAATQAAATDKGRLRCSLTALTLDGHNIATPDMLGRRAAVEVGTWQDAFTELRIHRSVLAPVFGPLAKKAAGESTSSGDYVHFRAEKITPQSDAIVANFERNAATAAAGLSAAAPRPSYSGFKALIGRHVEHASNSGEIEVDVYFRIIIDWAHQSPRHERLSVYRAAIVLSQVPVLAGGEQFYRFQPGRRPLRMLACVGQGARVI